MCDHESREDAMTVIRRDANGTPTVWCDPCIAPLIEALNAAGIATVASCCGHGHRPGFIMLADGRDLIVCRSHDEARIMERAWPVNNCGESIEPDPPGCGRSAP